MHCGRPTWAEIDLGAVAHNLAEARRWLAGGARIMPVIKANAYGHGIVEVARVCERQGVAMLGVALLDEALQLREAGITASPLLVLGYTPDSDLVEAIELGIRLTVFDRRGAQAASRAALACGKVARLHVKVDTGMGRLGFFPDDAGLAAMEEVWRLPGVEVEGVFTHFALADAADKTYTHWQLGRFRYVLERLQGAGLRPPIVHAANTAALMDVPEAHFDMVRLGIGLYGLQPSPEIRNRELQWQPAMRLLSTVVMLKEVPPGYSISYGCTYTTSRPTRVATVPIGYADGYTRLLSGKVHAVVKGQRVPCIGRICMDQCMFDVTDVPGVAEGDQVVLFGRPEDGVTADELAAALGTINYEIVCMVGPRVKRVYLDAQPGPEESAPGVRV